MQDGIDRLRDRHFDAEVPGQLGDFTGGTYPFGHVTQFFQNLRQRLASRQRQTDASVARKVAGTGQDQVAHASQAHEGITLAAEHFTQAGNFGKATGNQCRAGVEPKPQAIGNAGGDSQHVLDRAADFDAGKVIVGINAQARRVQRQCGFVGKVVIIGGERDGSRQAAGYFFGKTGAGKHPVAGIGA